jgi:hypothetical protein
MTHGTADGSRRHLYSFYAFGDYAHLFEFGSDVRQTVGSFVEINKKCMFE